MLGTTDSFSARDRRAHRLDRGCPLPARRRQRGLPGEGPHDQRSRERLRRRATARRRRRRRDAAELRFARASHLRGSPSGLVSVAGGKLTTYRAMGEAVVERAIRLSPELREARSARSRTRSSRFATTASIAPSSRPSCAAATTWRRSASSISYELRRRRPSGCWPRRPSRCAGRSAARTSPGPRFHSRSAPSARPSCATCSSVACAWRSSPTARACPSSIASRASRPRPRAGTLSARARRRRLRGRRAPPLPDRRAGHGGSGHAGAAGERSVGQALGNSAHRHRSRRDRDS